MERREINKRSKYYSTISNNSPSCLCGTTSDFRTEHQHETWDAWTNLISIPKCKIQLFKNSYFASTKIWNSLKPTTHNARIKQTCSSLINHNFEVSKRLFVHNVYRIAQVALPQIRTGVCILNRDLFIKRCIDSQEGMWMWLPKRGYKTFLAILPNIQCPKNDHDTKHTFYN